MIAMRTITEKQLESLAELLALASRAVREQGGQHAQLHKANKYLGHRTMADYHDRRHADMLDLAGELVLIRQALLDVERKPYRRRPQQAFQQAV